MSNEQAVEIVAKVLTHATIHPRHETHLSPGFLLLRLSLGWMAVCTKRQIVLSCACLRTQLLKEHPEPGAPIAELFIDKVLKYAVKRIKSEIPEEKHITLEKMKARPVGKADYTCRSCLHDDITAIIVQFSGLGGSGGSGGGLPEAETPLSLHSGAASGGGEAVLQAENVQLRAQVQQLQQRVLQLELELAQAKGAAGGTAAAAAEDDELESDV
jgi:hypothetical protein